MQSVSYDPNKIYRGIGRVEAIELDYEVETPWIPDPDSSSDSKGSGFFFRPDFQDPSERVRYFVTCLHCIRDAPEENGIFVTTSSGSNRRMTATVVAIFPGIDAAILDVDKDPSAPYEALELGDDKSLVNGEDLTVYGYPVGQSGHKLVQSSLNGRQDGSLQIDGAINEGHSGGCVLNSQGKVVGWVQSGLAKANSIAFAQPISYLLAMMPLVKSDTRNAVFRNCTLGIDIIPSTPALFESRGKPALTGPIVRRVARTSPFAGKINTGDIITAITIERSGIYGSGTDSRKFGEKGHRRRSADRMHAKNGTENRDRMSMSTARDQSSTDLRFEVGNDCMCHVDWTPSDRYDMRDLVKYFRVGVPVTLEVLSTDSDRLVKVRSVPKDNTVYGTRAVYRPFEKPKFECFSGIVMCDINRSIVDEVQGGLDMLTEDQVEEPWLIAVKILKSSTWNVASEARSPISAGDVIHRVNGVDVRNVHEYREALQKPINGAYMTIETLDGFSETLRMADILKNESNLIEIYGYPQLKTFIKAVRDAKQRFRTTSSDDDGDDDSNDSGDDIVRSSTIETQDSSDGESDGTQDTDSSDRVDFDRNNYGTTFEPYRSEAGSDKGIGGFVGSDIEKSLSDQDSSDTDSFTGSDIYKSRVQSDLPITYFPESDVTANEESDDEVVGKSDSNRQIKRGRQLVGHDSGSESDGNSNSDSDSDSESASESDSDIASAKDNDKRRKKSVHRQSISIERVRPGKPSRQGDASNRANRRYGGRSGVSWSHDRQASDMLNLELARINNYAY